MVSYDQRMRPQVCTWKKDEVSHRKKAAIFQLREASEETNPHNA